MKFVINSKKKPHAGILSDLKDAWFCLLEKVSDLPDSEQKDILLFHIEDAISWKSIRDFHLMQSILMLILNTIQTEKVGSDIEENVIGIRNILKGALVRIKRGEKL